MVKIQLRADRCVPLTVCLTCGDVSLQLANGLLKFRNGDVRPFSVSVATPCVLGFCLLNGVMDCQFCALLTNWSYPGRLVLLSFWLPALEQRENDQGLGQAKIWTRFGEHPGFCGYWITWMLS